MEDLFSNSIKVANRHERLLFEKNIQNDTKTDRTLQNNYSNNRKDYQQQHYDNSNLNNHQNQQQNQHQYQNLHQIHNNDHNKQVYSTHNNGYYNNINIPYSESKTPFQNYQKSKRDILWEDKKAKASNINTNNKLSDDFSDKKTLQQDNILYEVINRDNGIVNRNTPYTNQAVGSNYNNKLNNHQNIHNNIYSGAPYNEIKRNTPIDYGYSKYNSSKDQVYVFNNEQQMHNSSYYNKTKEVNIKPYNGNNQMNYDNPNSSRRATPFDKIGSFNDQIVHPQEGFHNQNHIYNNANNQSNYNNNYSNSVTPNTYKQYNNSNSFNKPFFREQVSRFN